MRIVQVIPVLIVGGLERVATNLSLGLHRRGERVVVSAYVRAHHMTTLRDELAAAGIDVVPIPRPRPSPRPLLRSSFAIARLLRREQPDIVHAHNPAAAVAAALARRLARCPSTAIVATYHGLATGETRRAVRPLRLAADIVVGIGPSATRELGEAGFPQDRLLTVANAVTATANRSAESVRAEFGVDDAELIVTVGRYTVEKNQRLLLEALAQLAPHRPRLRALLVGLGPLEQELNERIDELGLSAVAQVTGPRADAIDLIAAADLLVSTSTREGLGLTLLEALAVDTPVVATEVGGVVDVLAGGEAGILVPAGDARALAAAIERGLDDTALRQRVVMRGREHAAMNFGIDAMIDGYLAAYEAALSLRRNRLIARRSGASSSK